MASITKLPSGKWRALVRKRGSKPLSGTFEKKKDAEAWARAEELKLDSIKKYGKASTPKGSTFPDFIDKYVEETERVKPHGRNKKATLIRLKKEFDGVLMSDMSEKIISDFVSRRIEEKNQVGEPISGVTICVDLSYITSVLKWSRFVKHYNIDVEMANAVRQTLAARGLSTKSNERDREATDEELTAIFDEYQRKGARQIIPMTNIITFALVSAMRQEEICSILIEDIDFEARTVIIRNRKDPKYKIGNHQKVPLFDKAWELATKHIGERKSGRVFNYNHRSVSASFTRACAKLDIEDLHFHDLRHNAAGLLFELGLGIEQVALMTGHKDWKMLKRYTHIKAKDVHRAYREKLMARLATAEA